MLSTSVMSDSVTPWAVGSQAPLCLGFPRQECWSGLPCLPQGSSQPGIELVSFMSPVFAGGYFTSSTTWEAPKRNVFNGKFFSFLMQREVKGVDGKCSFCEHTGPCILGPFYDLSRRRNTAISFCSSIILFLLPSSMQPNLLRFPSSTKVHHSEEKLEIQKITSPASPEGQKEKFSLLPLPFSSISIY